MRFVVIVAALSILTGCQAPGVAGPTREMPDGSVCSVTSYGSKFVRVCTMEYDLNTPIR